MPYEIRRHRWGLYFAVENVSRSLPTRHTKDGVDVSLLKDIRPVSIESIKLFVTIHGMIADVTCQATFRNIEEEHIDGFFLFPVEDAAAFYHFEATIRGTKVVAATREKGEHWEYNLLEQLDGEGILLEESSREIFTCHLGVVAPDEVVETMFQFTLEMEVSQEGDVQFLFPSFVPREFQARYMEFAYGQMEQQSYSVDDYSFDFYFQANVASNYRIKDVVSREILEIEYLDQLKHNAKLMLAGSYLPNRDFAFVIRYTDLESPHLLIHKGMDACPYEHVVMKSACAYYTLFHRLNKAHVKALKGEFIICVDKSGPMRGAKSQLAREALLYFIKGLPQGCYFNIVAFSSTETPLFKSSRVYNQYNCMKAIKFQMKMRPEMMSSPNILSLLQYVYSQPTIAGHPKQVFIMTEGNVTNVADCIEYVQQREELARVFTIGIGDTAHRPLISGIARATNAKSHFIKLQDKPYNKILDCLKHALQPGLTNLELEFDTPAGVSCLTIPPTIPPIVFAEEKLSVFILIRGTPDDPTDTECSVTLKGNLGRDEPYSHTLNFDLRDQMSSDNHPIHRLALSTEIADLEKLITNALGADDVLEYENHIIQASLAGNIASRFTPMIGIDVHTGGEVEGYPIIKIRPDDNPYRINSSGMDMYMPGTGSVYKSVSRLTLNRAGMTPSNFVKGIFEQPNQGQPARQPGISPADSRMYDFDDEIGNADDLLYSRPPQKAALADIDSDMALSEVYMGVKNKDVWEEFKQSLKTPDGLVKLQAQTGYWMLNKNTAYAFGSTITDVKKDNPLKDDIIWTTVLAINWFYVNFPERRSEWKEAEDWARSWLYQQDLEGYSLDELLELAAEFKHLDGHILFQPQKTTERQISTISEEDPTANIPEPVQYIRQDSISMIPENIDYMGEDEYVQDDVGDIYSHYMEGVKQQAGSKLDSGRKPAPRKRTPQAAPRQSLSIAPCAADRSYRGSERRTSVDSCVSQDAPPILLLSEHQPEYLPFDRWNSSASLETPKFYQPIHESPQSAISEFQPCSAVERSRENHQFLAPPSRAPIPAERLSLRSDGGSEGRASPVPAERLSIREGGSDGRGSPRPAERTSLLNADCGPTSTYSSYSPVRPRRRIDDTTRRPNGFDRSPEWRGDHERESETFNTTQINSQRNRAADQLSPSQYEDSELFSASQYGDNPSTTRRYGDERHRNKPARYDSKRFVRRTVYTKTKRVTTATIYFTRYDKYQRYEQLHKYIQPGYTQL